MSEVLLCFLSPPQKVNTVDMRLTLSWNTIFNFEFLFKSVQKPHWVEDHCKYSSIVVDILRLLFIAVWLKNYGLFLLKLAIKFKGKWVKNLIFPPQQNHWIKHKVERTNALSSWKSMQQSSLAWKIYWPNLPFYSFNSRLSSMCPRLCERQSLT